MVYTLEILYPTWQTLNWNQQQKSKYVQKNEPLLVQRNLFIRILVVFSFIIEK